MTVTADQAAWFSQTFSAMVANCDKAVLGKEHVIRLALTCMLSEGHLLLEDFPGTGKTQLARAISSTVQGTNSRIQFTPDLLPSDVTGTAVFDLEHNRFVFRPGPIFAHIVLADEINRTSPKVQAAMLEAMAEKQVTIDNETHPLDDQQVDAIRKNLRTRMGTDIAVDLRIDPAILGGLVVKIGSRMIDGSIRTKLNSLAQAMRG